MAKRKSLKLACSFGNVSIGDETASICASIDRALLDMETADGTFCGRTLECILTATTADDDPDQQYLDGQEPPIHELACGLSSKGFAVGRKKVRVTLSTKLADLADVGTFSRFAKLTGMLAVGAVADLPVKEKKAKAKAAKAAENGDGEK